MEDAPFIVTYECRPSQGDGRWHQHVLYLPTKSAAIQAYNDLLPGPAGSFGPVEYRRVTFAQVLTTCEG